MRSMKIKNPRNYVSTKINPLCNPRLYFASANPPYCVLIANRSQLAMPTVTVTPHPTRKSSCVPKSLVRLGDSLPHLPQNKYVPTHILICKTTILLLGIRMFLHLKTIWQQIVLYTRISW